MKFKAPVTAPDIGDLAVLLTVGWGFLRVETGAIPPRLMAQAVREEFGPERHEDADWCACTACRAMSETVH